ncbi:MAG: DUF5664 domain-containing protein [Phycisphaerales bacterium]|nr:DUF5664 domain-containing protein [Phycisphaerales bacterium]
MSETLHIAGDVTIKDSGVRQEFQSGAQRDTQEGKGRMDLLPFFALMELAKIYEAGAKKYGNCNWRLGIPLSRFADSALRHLFKYMLGMRDEPHDAQALWNIAGMMETRRLIEMGALPKELDDLPRFDTQENTTAYLQIIAQQVSAFRQKKETP